MKTGATFLNLQAASGARFAPWQSSGSQLDSAALDAAGIAGDRSLTAYGSERLCASLAQAAQSVMRRECVCASVPWAVSPALYVLSELMASNFTSLVSPLVFRFSQLFADGIGN